MVKPFSIQAPEQVAKEYGGNKQKIAEAAQLGLVDPTAAVLAGMFIDKMRSAQQMEAGQKPTIAQQVLGAPQPQASAPQGMPPQMGGGLGATPQAMPQEMGAPPEMAMPQEMPPEMPQEMGMAEGGIVGLDLPDAMFDEPNNGGYAPGGLVAFAGGGGTRGVSTLDEAWNRIKRLEGGLGPKGEMRVSSAGAVGPSQLMPATAPEAAEIAGLPWDEKRYRTDPAYNEALGKAYYASRVKARGGDYNKAALDYHTGMGNVDKGKIGPAGREYLRKFSGAEGRAPAPTAGLGATAPATGAGGDTPWGGSLSGQLEGILTNSGGLYDKLVPAPKREARDALLAYAKEQNSPETLEKQRKQDMWSTLAEIGFNMAGTNSPSFLQAVGTAAAAALPGAKADKKAREERKREMLRTYAEVEGLDNADAKERVNGMLNLAETQLGIKKEDIGRKFEQDKTVFTQGQETARANASIAAQKDIAAAGNQTSKDVANISAGSYKNTSEKAIQQALLAAGTKAVELANDNLRTDPAYITARGANDDAGMKAAFEKLRQYYYNQLTVGLTGGGQPTGAGQQAGSSEYKYLGTE